MKKRSFIALLAAIVLPFTANAQEREDMGYFNHLSASYSLGTDGLVGFEVASPIGNYVTARMGYSFMPSFKAKVDIDYDYNKKNETAKMEGKLNMGDFKLLFDIHPSRSSSFRFVAGFFLGKENLLEAYTTEPLTPLGTANWGGVGRIQIGTNPDNMFGTDRDGNLNARVRVNTFKPYLGIGFGRAIPKKLVSVCFDLGVQFWGKPKVEIFDYHDPLDVTKESSWVKLTKDDFEKTATKERDKDGYDALNIVDKISVYPVLNLRINFRCF